MSFLAAIGTIYQAKPGSVILQKPSNVAPPRGVPTYSAPTYGTVIPVTSPTYGTPVPTTSTKTTTTTTSAPVLHTGIVTTTATSGDAFVSGAAPTATGSATGTQTGSTGSDAGSSGTGTDTSRLFDLIASAFKPQDIGQTYGPQSVSSDAMGTQSSGTNPMAVVILAIVVMGGIFLYAHSKKGRAA